MKRIAIALIVFFLFFLPAGVEAHQPRVVSGEETVKIKNPEVSQAFYGELKGKPALFEIDSDEGFKLYTGLLVPDLPGVKKDISARVYSVSNGLKTELIFLEGKNFSWTPFFEEFAGDNYFKGPETRAEFKPGKYLFEIFSPSNSGKYVLVLGEKEEFPFKEAVKAIFLLPLLKQHFFQKSPLSAFSGKIGIFLLIPLVIFLVVLILVVFFFRLRRKPRLSSRK